MLLHIIIPFAHAETVPIEGVGTGQTREAAVNAALADAVRQATDTEVSSSSKARLTERDQSIKVDGAEQATSALTSDTDRKIQSESEGNVAGYTVMSEQQDPATGEWRVGLLANVVRFAPVGNAEIQALIKMAIIPFRWAVVEQPGNDQAPKDFTSYLDGAIQAYFTQSRQFNVLDRKYISERMAEQGYVSATSQRAEELIKLGQTLATDWILTGEISAAKIIRTPVLLKNQGIYDEDISISVQGEYRVIDMATTQAKRVVPIRYSVKASTLPSGTMSDAQKMWRAVADLIGQGVEEEIVGAIFPIRVAAIHEDGEIVLDRGGLSIHEGDRYVVFKVGGYIRKPGSGASLGQDETPIGTIQIARMIAKQSFARVIVGDIAKVSVGDICRREESAARTESAGASLSSEDQRLKDMIARGALTTEGFADVLRGKTAEEVASILDRRPVKAFDHGSQRTEIYRVLQQGKDIAQLEVTYSSKGVVILVR
jgi:hypothetical protein